MLSKSGFSILALLLLTASPTVLLAQDVAASNSTSVVEPVVVDVTTAKPATPAPTPAPSTTPAPAPSTTAAPAVAAVVVTQAATTLAPEPEPTTAEAVLIIEEPATTSAPAAPVTTTQAPAPVVTTKAPEPAKAPAAPAIKPAEPATTKAPEVVTKAPEVSTTTTKAPEVVTKAPEAPTTTTTKAPEVVTKAPEAPTTTTTTKAPVTEAPAKAPKPEVAPTTTEAAPTTTAAAPKVTTVKPEEKKSKKPLPVPSPKSTEEKKPVVVVTTTQASVEKTTTSAVAVETETETEATLADDEVVIVEPNGNITVHNRTEEDANSARAPRLINDFMSDELRNNGGVIVHILLLIYVCLALGIICDAYFLSSLEFISSSLNIPADIAGATFMAIGTSAPELFTSLIGVFILHDDIGTGTILGSAVFNLIFIPAVCGLTIWRCGAVQAKISKYSILRDCLFYFVTITTLLLVLKDNEVDWVESLCMLGLFVVYLIIMYYNAKIGDMVKSDSEQAPLLGGSVTKQSDEWDNDKNVEENAPIVARQRSYSIVTEEGDVQEDSWMNSSVLLKVLMFPAMILFKITLPKPTKLWYPVTFVIAIIWISVLTYISVYLVDIIGVTFGIPETVGGLTLLAAGTSFPELISSVLVVKRAGLADMALCNSIGSNIFDILVCLGLPWFVKSIIAMISLNSLDLVDTMVPIQSMGLSFTTFSLLITIILFVATLSCFKWRMGFGVGLTCLILYVLFLTLATVNEIVLN